MKKKIIAIFLATSFIFSAMIIPASANTVVTDPSEQKLYTVLDKVVDVLVGGIANLIIGPKWEKKADYKAENFYEGNTFIDEPADGAKWKLGYSNASLLTGKEVGGGDYYVGGSLSVTKKLATAQYDDQKVRTVAISDGRGITIFSSLDAYGMALTDVRGIRAKFAEIAKQKGYDITAINISALHQHCCVDTFGMNGDLFSALFTSSFRNLFGLEVPSGQNKEYMDNLYKVVVNSMVEAVENMEEGKLYYGSIDASDLIYDKRDPKVFDTNLNRFRFVPDNEESQETWMLNANIHCVGMGAAGTVLSGDYPYTMEKYINEHANANYYYVEGAELAITLETDGLEIDPEIEAKYGDRYARTVAYGNKIGERACAIDKSKEKEVEPILNIAFKEVFLPINNNILKLAAKGGLLLNKVVRDGFNLDVVTEIGYAEFGKDYAVAIVPGELAPEIAFGGADTAATSWTGEDWNYPSFAEVAGNRKLLVFGLTNDQVGYMVTDNNWHSFFTENEEIVSTGSKAGSTMTQAFIDLYKSIDR